MGLVAMIGGALAALPLLVKRDDDPIAPYTLSTWLALIKLPAAAVAGLAGVYAVQRGLITIAKPPSGQTILAYAIAFGASQELVTHALDDKASSVLTKRASDDKRPAGRK